MRPDADLMIDVHFELERKPDPTGAALRKEYLRAIENCIGTMLSICRVQDSARRLRNWLKVRGLERSERVKRK